MLYFEMFRVFFMIGAFTIGGGYAMVPIIEKEVVDKKKWLNNKEFMEALAVAQSLPGVLAVNLSIYIGLKIKGYKGAFSCMIGAVLPSFLIILLVANFYNKLADTKIVDKIFKGALPAVAAVIAAAVYTLGKKSKFKYYHYIVAILVALSVELLNLSPIFLILVFGIGYIIYKKLVLSNRRGD
ncbi:chromate transporter [Miniphocaeibacter massiliensis]|uniref:chromate transporter n=1 Tax=Miniphocaeibacter massiliensis TaxID=2041841 RepID=UPI001F5C5BDE|nr:chromate transporter [Miniphocaeibacter massiliensis]